MSFRPFTNAFAPLGVSRTSGEVIDLTSNIVGHWTFDNTPNDSSGNGRNFSAVNGPTYGSPGRVGSHYASLASASSQYLNGADWFHADVFSIAAWVYPATVDTNSRSIIVKRNSSLATAGTVEWALHQDSANGVSWFCGDSTNPALNAISIVSGSALPSNTWSHVAVVQRGSGNTCSLYVNGTEVASATQAAVMRNTTSVIQMGVRTNNDNNRYWNGRFDDVRIYNRALTPTEIAALAAM